MKPSPLPLLLLLFLLAACGESPKMAAEESTTGEKLIIATAANVQFAMEALVAAFEEETGVKPEVVVSSSGKLTAQIQQGAPFDLFVSADTSYPQLLYREGKAAAPPQIYAYGALVLWTLDESLDLQAAKLEQVLAAATGKIALPNPKNAPYGQEAIRALTYYGLLEKLESRLVYGESIAQTNQYLLSQAAGMGFTAKSVVVSPEMQDKGQWIAVDPAAYQPIAQGAVITRYGQEQHPEASQRFFEFLFSEKGRAVLEEYGYGLP